MTARCSLLVLLMVVCGCGSSSEGDRASPSDAIHAYQKALQAGDRGAIQALLHPITLEHLAREMANPPFLNLLDRVRALGWEARFEVTHAVIDGHWAVVMYSFPSNPNFRIWSMPRHGVFHLHRHQDADGGFGDWQILNVAYQTFHSENLYPGANMIELPRVANGEEDPGNAPQSRVLRIYVSGEGRVSLEDGVTLEPDALIEGLRTGRRALKAAEDADREEERKAGLPPQRPLNEGNALTRPRVHLHVHADRATPWITIQEILRKAEEALDHLDGVTFAVRGPWPAAPSQRLSVRMVPWLSSAARRLGADEPEVEEIISEEREPIPIELVTSRRGTDPGLRIGLRLADAGEITFPNYDWPNTPSEIMARKRKSELAVDAVRKKIITIVGEGAYVSAACELRFAKPVDRLLLYSDVIRVIDVLNGLSGRTVQLVGVVEGK